MKKYAKVVAKAGSGKTEVVKECYIALVNKLIAGGCTKEEAMNKIFMATFTDAAANEMKERIIGSYLSDGVTLTDEEKDAMHITTFDSFHYSNICNNYGLIDTAPYDKFTDTPKIIDTNELREKQIIKDVVTNPEISGLNYEGFLTGFRTDVLNIVYPAFKLIDAEHIDASASDRYDRFCEAAAEYSLKNIPSVSVLGICDAFIKYHDVLNKNNFVSYSGAAGYGLQLIQNHPEILEDLGYEYIIVDESQDSDGIQLETLKCFKDSKCFKAMMVVGDENQAIYGFRHTNPDNLIHFHELIGAPEEESIVFTLADNYRSTEKILGLADEFVKLNLSPGERDKFEPSIPYRKGGEEPIVKGFYRNETETDYVVKEIAKLHEAGTDWEDCAVIVRTSSEIFKFGNALTKAGIPWISKCPMKLIDNSRVQAAIALAEAIRTPESASKNCLNYLIAKHDGVVDDELAEFFSDELRGLIGQVQNFCFKDFDKQRASFHRLLEELKRPTDELYDYFLDCVYECEDFPTEIQYIVDMPTLAPSFKKKMDKKYMGVVLTTAHSSKGLEWDNVFVSLSEFDASIQPRRSEVQETRRLIYVSLTRAKNLLYVTGRYKASGYGTHVRYNQYLAAIFTVSGQEKDYCPIDEEEEKRKLERKKSYKAEAKKKAEASVAGFGLAPRDSFEPGGGAKKSNPATKKSGQTTKKSSANTKKDADDTKYVSPFRYNSTIADFCK